jgi:hypothetical protein
LRETSAMSTDQRDPAPTPEHEARDSRTANIVLLVGAAIVIGGGIWLVDALLTARKADDCISAGRRNCTPLEMPVQR